MKIVALIVFILHLLHSNTLARDKKPSDISGEESCLTPSCHTGMAQKEFVHVPASDGDMCTECHEMPTEGRHTFGLKAEAEELCYQCHESKAEAEYIHVPVEAGDCLECHDPHQSENEFQLRFPPTSELCFQCHDADDFKAGGSVHGPVSEGLCLKCHDPHSSDYTSQTKGPMPQLCLGCHDKSQKDPEGVRLPPIKAIYEDKEIKLHQPFGEGKCTLCHDPHTSDQIRLLKKRYPALFYARFSLDEYALCLGCHKSFAKVLTEPRTLTDTNFRNGNLNLHYRHVNKKKGRTCRACHHHHGSKNSKLIRAQVPFGVREISLLYEKTETGGECTPTCHTLVRYDRYEPVFNALKTTPREGVDATEEELKKSRKRD